MQYFEQVGSSLYFRQDGETLHIQPWGENSFRVRSTVLGDPDSQPDAGALLPREDCPVQITIDGDKASITNGRITARMEVQDWGKILRIHYLNRKGEVLLEEIPNGGCLQLSPRAFSPLQGDTFKLKATFVSDPDEKLYGMGQYQQERMNLKGCNMELAHRNSQASVPFCLSSRGYGFLWHNAAIGEVHFGSNTTEWVAESTRVLDYWITAGDTPAQIVEAYTQATGLPPMMPEYGLGYWQCKLRYYNQQQVLDIAREYKRRNIPVDVLVIDYYHWPRCGDWRFDEEYFPDPRPMVEELKKMGIETMVSIWPQVDWRSENYEEMKQQGLLVKSNYGVDVQMVFHGNNVFIDVTNPRARQYFWEKAKKNYADLGIKLFWLDEAEPEFTGYNFSQYRYYAGPVAEMGNIYPREYARAFCEGQQSDGRQDVVNLIRCAWAGSQRYGALVWSGDIMSNYDDFRKQICAGLHMGISGIPWWTTDIGGFHGGDIRTDEFKELLVRWFQYGTFLPVMRMHGCRQPATQIVNKAGEVREQTGADNEVWSYGPEVEKILVKFIGIREKMRDYTRSVMENAHEQGDPVIRTLFYGFPEDKTAWDITDEYLYGPDLLVAPVCHPGAVKRSVYLPAGASWTHAGTGKVYQGGASYEIDCPIDTLPVFLRDGRQAWLQGML